MSRNQIQNIALGAMIASMYVVLTVLTGAFGLASGVIQVRLSDALCIMPYFTPSAIPGLTIGCVLSNLLVGGNLVDTIFGSIATLLGALVAYLIRRFKYAVPAPTILANAAIVPLVLIYGYKIDMNYWYLFATVGAGEAIACGLLGEVLLVALDKVPMFRKMATDNKRSKKGDY